MEAIIIPKDQFNELLAKVEHIIKTIDGITASPKESFVDNAEFIRLMGISKRTAQTWRDEQRISFSQIGSKIYYSLSDVNQLLAKNHRPAYTPRSRSRH
ncbi:MAG: helix-turn-helix domain-containing protein [Bacteroidales bacterium]|nr:helix-turn-helix domain-containing protein [Bacteroidales bacterium]